jgi:Tfp pilus assembly protein PilX
MNAARRGRMNDFGFALVPALFLLVIVGALGLIALRVGIGQERTVVMGLMQARALSAANSGVEWGAYNVVGALNLSAPICAPSTTLTLTEASFTGFSVVVTCAATTIGTTGNSSYVINATATSGTYGQPAYVRRTVSGTFTNATS